MSSRVVAQYNPHWLQVGVTQFCSHVVVTSSFRVPGKEKREILYSIVFLTFMYLLSSKEYYSVCFLPNAGFLAISPSSFFCFNFISKIAVLAEKLSLKPHRNYCDVLLSTDDLYVFIYISGK